MIEFLKVNLSNNIAIFIIIILFFFCAYFLIKNKKLKQEIEDLKLEIKPTLKKEKNIKEDIIPIKNISKEIKEEKIEAKELEKQVSENINKGSSKIDEIQKIKPIKQNNKPKTENKKNKIELYQNEYNQKKTQNINQTSKQETKKELYTKNVLHNSPKITSPVSINNETIEENKKFNINEFVKKDKNNNQKKKETTKEDYLKEISEQIASEIKPQTIELTEYEKNEEENAIISYKELLNAKDKIKMLDDEDETIDFIEELKKLRNSLN